MTQEPMQDPGWQPGLRVPSDKCDFAAPARMPSDKCDFAALAMVASDKCDFAMPVSAVSQPAKAELTLGTAAQRLRMDSDKCDWRIAVSDTVGRTVSVSAGESDWVVDMAGIRPGMRTPPRVRAEMVSDKCDFNVRLELGLQGGPSVRMRAVGSDKCDFRIVEYPEDLRATGRPSQPDA